MSWAPGPIQHAAGTLPIVLHDSTKTAMHDTIYTAQRPPAHLGCMAIMTEMQERR